MEPGDFLLQFIAYDGFSAGLTDNLAVKQQGCATIGDMLRLEMHQYLDEWIDQQIVKGKP